MEQYFAVQKGFCMAAFPTHQISRQQARSILRAIEFRDPVDSCVLCADRLSPGCSAECANRLYEAQLVWKMDYLFRAAAPLPRALRLQHARWLEEIAQYHRDFARDWTALSAALVTLVDDALAKQRAIS
jgi:hypothetical protein